MSERAPFRGPSDAFTEGEEAWIRGKPYRSPEKYADDSQEQLDWCAGWNSMHDAMEGE